MSAARLITATERERPQSGHELSRAPGVVFCAAARTTVRALQTHEPSHAHVRCLLAVESLHGVHLALARAKSLWTGGMKIAPRASTGGRGRPGASFGVWPRPELPIGAPRISPAQARARAALPLGQDRLLVRARPVHRAALLLDRPRIRLGDRALRAAARARLPGPLRADLLWRSCVARRPGRCSRRR